MRTWLAALSSAFVVGFLLAACGARDLEAPRPEEKPADLAACSFDHMMPSFVAAISTGKTQNLKNVVESQLLKPLREGDTPPAADVLRSVFATLDRYARKGPEAGAASGQQCASITRAPPLNQANELCEMRRMLELFIHDPPPDGGTVPAGVEAIKMIEPQLLGVMDYMDGNGTDHLTHYEVATVLSQMATNSGVCQMSDGLDFIIGFADYANTPAGDALVKDLNALLGKDSIRAFLSAATSADGGTLDESGFVAIARTLIPAIQSADPVTLDNAFNQLPLPDQLKADVTPAFNDLKTLMGNTALMTPMKRSLNCYTSEDRNFDVIRMAYRLAIRDKNPAFGFTRLAGVLQELKALDSRGSLLFIVGSLARGIRADERAIDSTSLVVHTLFRTEHYTICKEAVGAEPSPEVACLRDGDCVSPQRCLPKARSNAELIVPTLADLVRGGIVNEAFCAIDTLVFGCAGGTQPACLR